MNEIYLFRTVKEGSRNRLRPMPFQTGPDGKPLITDLNVQANMTMRTNYPTAIFASEMVKMAQGGSTPFYSAGDIYPVSIPRDKLISPSDIPTDKMYETYHQYMATYGDKLKQSKDITEDQQSTVSSTKPLTLLEKLQCNPRFEMPTIEKEGFWVSDETWWPLMLNIIENENTMFIGPQGTGKTEIVRVACEKIGIPLHIFDMGSMYDAMSEMLGVHRISEKGTSIFDYANFTKAIQTECVILLDELSRANPSVTNILLPVLDARRELRVEMAGEKDQRRIPVHPKCRFIATANIGSEFTGVAGEMDRALKDRFFFMEMGYMPYDKEVDMLMKKCKIGKADAVNLVKVATNIRSIAEREEISTNISTREVIMAARKIRQGYPARTAMEMVFLPLFSGTRAEGERAIVFNTILQR